MNIISSSRWFGCVAFAALLAVIVPLASVARAEMVIDDFELPNDGAAYFVEGEMPGTNSILIQQQALGVIGGQREVFVDVLGDAEPISASVMSGYDSVNEVGLLQVATFGNPGTCVMLQYDGEDEGVGTDQIVLANSHGLLHDLTGGGQFSSILFRFAGCDGVEPLGLDTSITATTPQGDLTWSGYLANSGGPAERLVPFAWFTATPIQPNDPPSFSSIDSLTFEFNGNGTPDVDFELDLVAVVPEPSTWVLLGVACCILVVHGRRRRQR